MFYYIILATLLSPCHFQWAVNLIACLQIFFFHWLNYQKPVWWLYHFFGPLGLECALCNALKCICMECLLNIFCTALWSPLERHPHTSQTGCSWLQQIKKDINPSIPHEMIFQIRLNCNSTQGERGKKEKMKKLFLKAPKCSKKWSGHFRDDFLHILSKVSTPEQISESVRLWINSCNSV